MQFHYIYQYFSLVIQFLGNGTQPWHSVLNIFFSFFIAFSGGANFEKRIKTCNFTSIIQYFSHYYTFQYFSFCTQQITGELAPSPVRARCRFPGSPDQKPSFIYYFYIYTFNLFFRYGE